MVDRIYLDNYSRTSEAIEWLFQSKTEFKILRGEKALHPNTSVRRTDVWRSNVYINIPDTDNIHYNADFFEPYWKQVIREAESDHNVGITFNVGFVIYDQNIALEFKLIFG